MCAAIAPVATEPASAMPACLEEARAVVRNTKNRPDFEEFFGDMPECASTPGALIKMFSCVSAESEEVKGLYDVLRQKGYTDPSFQGGDFCEISADEIRSDEVTARSLTNRLEAIAKEADAVADCRASIAKWLDDKSKLDAQDLIMSAQMLNRAIELMQQQLAPLEEQDKATATTLTRIKRDVSGINDLVGLRIMFCAG